MAASVPAEAATGGPYNRLIGKRNSGELGPTGLRGRHHGAGDPQNLIPGNTGEGR
jgi:hypothetical protein